MVEIYELNKLFDFEICTVSSDCWSNQNDVIIEILVELLDFDLFT